jgi:hypothetical protein
MMQTRFRRELNALPAIFAMSEEFCASHPNARPEKHTIDFVLEEIFTNLVKYGVRRPDEIVGSKKDGVRKTEDAFARPPSSVLRSPDEILITLDIALNGTVDQLVVSVTEFDAERFDIRDAPPPDLLQPLDERKPGGLGIHLIKKMVDRIDYDYRDRTSKTTMYKKLD